MSIGIRESMLPLGGYINQLLDKAGSKVGIGGWQEDRALYETSHHFDNDEGRKRSYSEGGGGSYEKKRKQQDNLKRYRIKKAKIVNDENEE